MLDKSAAVSPAPPSRKRWWATYGIISIVALIATMLQGRPRAGTRGCRSTPARGLADYLGLLPHLERHAARYEVNTVGDWLVPPHRDDRVDGRTVANPFFPASHAVLASLEHVAAVSRSPGTESPS